MFQSNTSHRSLISMLAGLILALSLCLSSGAASALGATSIDMPLHYLRSADCTGEVVEISGTIHMLNQVQVDGSVVGHFNYSQVTGLGLTSGNTYQTTPVENVRLSAPFPSNITSVRSFLLVSRGASSNLLVQATYHITISATGQINASIEDMHTQCT